MTDDELDSLELRALDDASALEQLLIVCAQIANEPHLFAPNSSAIDRCERSLDLVDVAGQRALTVVATRAVATIAGALGRIALANGVVSRATALLERACSLGHAHDDRAARAMDFHDLARCLDLEGATTAADQRWRECLEACSTMEPNAQRDFFEAAAAERLAARARESGSTEEAARLEQIADACDDREVEREVLSNEPAERFFSGRWNDLEPPNVPHERDWIERSQGVVHARRSARERAELREIGTVDCPVIFGTDRDDRCACGSLEGRAARGAVCSSCGVEVQRAIHQRARLGHIELVERALHPAALLTGPHGSMVALALDLDEARLALVRTRARCIRYAAIDPRGVDTLAPDSEELAAFDAGRGDPAFNVATGDDAVIDALDRLDATGARDEVDLELRALRGHKTATQPHVLERIGRLAARREVLVMTEKGTSLVTERVPVLSSVRLAELGCREAVQPLYEALLSAQSRGDVDEAAAAIARAFSAVASR